MKSLLFRVLCLLALCGGGPLRAQQTNQALVPPESIATGGPAAAQAATDVWLGLVDDGQYDKGWQAASSLFQKAVPQSQWTGRATARRTPLGKMVGRRLKNATFMKTLPGAPTGQYVVVDYDTSFEHKKRAIETVTAMLDKDGQWRVSGYFVR